MADQWYTKAKEGFAGADIDWENDNIKCVAVDAADYTLAITTDEFLDDIPAGARVATSGNLGTKTITNGVLDAADLTLSSVTGDQFEYLIVYQDSGVESTSRLILCFDQDGGGAMAVTPNGTDIDITWDNGASKIGAL